MAAKPTSAKLYQTPQDSGQSQSGPVYPAVPAPAPTQAMTFNQRYHPHAAAEMNSDMPLPPTGPNLHVPPVGTRVVHRTSGQEGVVTGHRPHGYSGTAVPQVVWAGEDMSWPQGVSANALRVQGSEPSDLYTGTQSAASTRPRNRNTGAL